MTKKINDFSTSDLNLIAALYCNGFKAEDKVINSNIVIFIFPSTKKLQNLISKFQKGSLDVDAQSYSTYLKIIKDQIYTLLRQNNE